MRSMFSSDVLSWPHGRPGAASACSDRSTSMPQLAARGARSLVTVILTGRTCPGSSWGKSERSSRIAMLRATPGRREISPACSSVSTI